MGLTPSISHVQRDGQWVDVPTAEVQVGDILQVRAGEKVPVYYNLPVQFKIGK